jgi:hypothetical protein
MRTKKLLLHGKRLILRIAAILAAVTLVSDDALALASGPPSDDSYVDVNYGDDNYDGKDLVVAASTTACSPNTTIYLKWDLADVPDGTSIHTAILTLTTVDINNTSGARLTLYAVEDTYVGTTIPWEEEELTYDNAPTISAGAAIETQDAPTAGGQVITFNSTALKDYVNAQAAGDNTASFALRFSSGCPSGWTVAGFEDRENVTNSPDLQLLNLNTVRWHTLRAGSPASCWALAGVLGILVLPAIGRLVAQRGKRRGDL